MREETNISEAAERPVSRSRELLANATARPWYYDGRDIFSETFRGDGHRLVVPMPDTWHESQRVPDADVNLIVAAVNEYEALLDVAEAARQLVRRDIPVSVVALFEANLLVALANLDALRSDTGNSVATEKDAA